MRTRKITIIRRFEGIPKLSDFQLVEDSINEDLEDGEILCQAEWLSVDPYMRMRANVGEPMMGMQVARVFKSRSPNYPEGSQVVGNFGWVEHTRFKPLPEHGVETIYKMPDMRGLPDSLALGAVGRPGNTAYFGLLRVCDLKEGEILVVSAAAGAVGSLVGQIGRLKGCKILAFTGSPEKVAWLKDELCFDHVFNYKTVDVPSILSQYAPEGIDKYFDNVGGAFSFDVTKQIKSFGKIGLCGAISTYNSYESNQPTLVPFNYGSMIRNNIKLEGFHVLRWKDEWFTGINQMRDWILEGKIKVKETITDGFENTPKAFIEMLEGNNFGKAVVRV